MFLGWLSFCCFFFPPPKGCADSISNGLEMKQYRVATCLPRLPPRNQEVFKRDICHPLLVLHGWKTTMIRSFGALASDLPAFSRLIQSLCSKGGLAQVSVCMASKTKLHGNSDSDIGIKDCRSCHDSFIGPHININIYIYI